MIAHTIVYLVLSLLACTAAYAASTPITGPKREQHETSDEAESSAAEKDSNETLQ